MCLCPSAGQFNSACQHGLAVHILHNQFVIDISQDRGTASFHGKMIGISCRHIALGHDCAVALQIPAAVRLYGKRITIVIGSHTSLAADHKGCISCQLRHVHTGGIIHPAEISQHCHGISAVPLVYTCRKLLNQFAVFHNPGSMAVQQISGLISPGFQVICLFAAACFCVININVRLFSIIKVVSIQIFICSHIVFPACAVCIQHIAVFIMYSLFGYTQRLGICQRSRCYHTVCRYGYIPHAIGSGHQSLIRHIAVRGCFPYAQLCVSGYLQAFRRNAEGFRVLCVIYKNG